MGIVRLKELGVWAALAAGAGLGCGAGDGSSTTTKSSALQPMPNGGPFEAMVRQTNTIADQPGFARTLDADLQNAWGIVFRGDSVWLTANHTGTDRQYSEDGKPGEVITMTDSDGMTAASPTGQVANPFPHLFMGDAMIAASEDGDIFGVNPGTSAAAIRVNNEGAAIYKGAAVAMFRGQARLFATDFHNRKVDVFDSDYMPIVKLGGAFVDPELATLTETVTAEDGTTIAEMYAPFNILPFGDRLLITFALQKGPENGDDDGGPHRGFVDIFDTDGNFIQRLITRGRLNSPWGLALSREHDGDVDLVVGNFGDGHINVYGLSAQRKRVRADFEGQLGNRRQQPIVIEGLWGIAFGPGTGGFGADDLYFAAGPGNGEDVETHGLFGELDFGPRR